jgi:pseudaminic acid cytidylyltransferase
MHVAIMPARQGSKRVLLKNFREICGRPAFSWPLDEAINTNIFDVIHLSTDFTAAVAENGYSEYAHFGRPASLSGDDVGLVDVVTYCIDRLDIPDTATVCLIYPTAVLLKGKDLINAVSQYESDCSFSIISVGRFGAPIEWAAERNLEGQLKFISPEYLGKSSHDMSPKFFDSGEFFVSSAEAFRSNDFGSLKGVQLDFGFSVDIDDESDWSDATKLLTAMILLGER